MYRPALLALLATLATPNLAFAQGACLVGAHPAISDADAETATGIVCEQLRKAGVAVGEATVEAAQALEVYRVSLRPLGRKVYLTLQREQGGTLTGESQLLLQEIEEVPVAAPRVVQALLSDKSVEQTATVNNLVGEEVRHVHKRDGEGFFNLGIAGLAVPNTDVVGGAGFIIGGSYEADDFGAFVEWRIAGGEPQDDQVVSNSFGVGGRWFMTDGNWSPFVTGGLAFSSLSVESPDLNDGTDSGLSAFAGIGVEALRFYHSRFSVDLRSELPFYKVADRYYVPISLGITYGF